MPRKFHPVSTVGNKKKYTFQRDEDGHVRFHSFKTSSKFFFLKFIHSILPSPVTVSSLGAWGLGDFGKKMKKKNKTKT